jgi:hypothetical protein
MGQLELINEIFRDNYELCTLQDSEAYLTYIVRLIQTHGFYDEFLDTFRIFYDASVQEDTLPMAKKILSCLLDEEYL